MKCAICATNCILVYTVCIAVFAQKVIEPDEENDEGGSDEKLTEKPVKEICQFLIDTDKTLVEKYSARPKGEGETIMALVREYNDALATITKRAFKEKKLNKTATVIPEAQTLIEHGGPQFINFYVELPILQERFGLNNVSSRILYCQRQNTIDIWQDFYSVYSKIKDEEDEEDI